MLPQPPSLVIRLHPSLSGILPAWRLGGGTAGLDLSRREIKSVYSSIRFKKLVINHFLWLNTFFIGLLLGLFDDTELALLFLSP